MRSQLGRNPSAAEIGELVGLGAKQVEHAWQLTSQPASLDAPDGGDDSGSLAERLAETGASPEAEVERRALCADVHDALAALTPDERRVLALRYGIGHPRAYSPQEIEGLTGLSKHRTQRLEIQALARLRSSHASRLRTYV